MIILKIEKLKIMNKELKNLSRKNTIKTVVITIIIMLILELLVYLICDNLKLKNNKEIDNKTNNSELNNNTYNQGNNNESNQENNGKVGLISEIPSKNGYTGVLRIVYLDPTDLTKICTASDVNSDIGTKTGCMKWYAYAEGATTYTMILDHNTSAGIKWNGGANGNGMKKIVEKFKSDTKDWASELNARLITIDEICEITENMSWCLSTKESSFYFDTLTLEPTYEGKYGWLYDRASSDCESYGCLNNATGEGSTIGYWTGDISYINANAWNISSQGFINVNYIGDAQNVGLRPIITVSKSIIK
ncbi:MAG: hypothetical protein NC181_05695 [Clostridium sp.]|nr:hypothetical protein [Clostridium sp.]